MLVNMSKYLEKGDYLFEEIKSHLLTSFSNLESSFKNHIL
jgi:hypothetical protein